MQKCLPVGQYRLAIGQPGKQICNPEQHIFPEDLYHLLRKHPGVNKTLVIQACHSGGFIDRKLSSLPNLTMVTASRADRVSFGCQPDERFTYFGKAFLHSLADVRDWQTIDWQELYQKTAQQIQRRERAMRIPSQQQSLPQFFSSEKNN